MSRKQIRMTPDEVGAFLAQERTLICATIGQDGFPHLMPLWFVVGVDASSSTADLWSWTFAKSQKVRNLERDPRATLQVEAGTDYHELRGVMLKVDVTMHRDVDRVAELGLELFARQAGDHGEVGEETRTMVFAQAPKRVALQFRERSRATWDHRKLPPATY